MENLWELPGIKLRHMLVGLNHAAKVVEIFDSAGKKVSQEFEHYLGCKRCLIESILKDREAQAASLRKRRGCGG